MTESKQTRKNPKKPAQTRRNPSVSEVSLLGRNASALEVMIAALDELGRLERIDAARVQIARSLAQLVDSLPENPLLWRQYRDAENVLRTVGESAGDDFSDLLRSLDSAIRDEEKPRAKKPRK